MSPASPDTDAPGGLLRARLRALVGPPLEPELSLRFEHELHETTRRRLTVLFPLVLVGHVVHIWVFHTSSAERAALRPRIEQWRDGIAFAHFATLVLLVVLGTAMYLTRRKPAGAWLGPAAATLYLVHGAVVAGIDQLVVTAITPFMAYCVVLAVTLALTPRAALLSYGVGLTSFVVAIVTLQASTNARLAILPNGISTVAVSITLIWLLHASRRRAFVQNVTIEEQRHALAQLNQSLERRVAEQVAEIVARAGEVDRLNAQLQAQVRERSTELARALARLARQQTGEGKLLRGTLLGGRFEVGRVLGEGGMGIVYAGVDRTTGARVAIKVVQARSSQLDAVQRFLREARAVASVTHPAIVRMLHIDVSEDGTLFQVQELVDGEVLESRLRRGSRWDPCVVARLAGTLFDALAAAHAIGIVHRDVKPGNLMLTASHPGLKLFDFGISKLYEDVAVDAGRTHTGTILGTPAYMAPEQVTASRDTTDRVDVYAVGVLLFQLLTGRYPFEDSATARGLAHEHISVAPPDARTLAPAVPESLAELVAQCLLKDPSRRPAAAELSARTAALANTHATPALDELEREGALRDLDAVPESQIPTVVSRSQRP